MGTDALMSHPVPIVLDRIDQENDEEIKRELRKGNSYESLNSLWF